MKEFCGIVGGISHIEIETMKASCISSALGIEEVNDWIIYLCLNATERKLRENDVVDSKK